MKHSSKSFRTLLLSALTVLLLGIGACTHSEQAVRPSSGGELPLIAPDFTIRDLYGRDVSLSDFEGRVVLVYFWASWCPPCRRSIPELVSLQERYGDDGFTIIGISVDKLEELDDATLKSFVEQNRISYPILRDEGVLRVVNEYFRGERLGIPAMFIVDRNGFIVERYIGFTAGALEVSLGGLL